MTVRRVDFDAANWIADTFNLGLAERGLLSTAWALIVRAGGPVSRDDLRRGCSGDVRPFNKALDRMIDIGTFVVTGEGLLDVVRCEIELERARKRIATSTENGRKHGPHSSKNISLENRQVSHTRATLPGETKLPILDPEGSKGGLGRSAPSETAYQDTVSPADVRARTDEEIVEVDELVASLGRAPAIRDPVKYAETIEQKTFQSWLRNLNQFASDTFGRGARETAAQEVIEAAWQSGNRDRMTPEVRKSIDELDKLYRAAAGMPRPARKAKRSQPPDRSAPQMLLPSEGGNAAPPEPFAAEPPHLSDGGHRTARAAARGGAGG